MRLTWLGKMCPKKFWILYGVESAKLSPQVKKKTFSVHSCISIQTCTHSCMHVQVQTANASQPRSNYYSYSLITDMISLNRAFVVTSTQNHQIIHLFIIYSTKHFFMSSLLTFVKTRERSLIFSWLKKSSFLKSMLLPNFAFDVINTGN